MSHETLGPDGDHEAFRRALNAEKAKADAAAAERASFLATKLTGLATTRIALSVASGEDFAKVGQLLKGIEESLPPDVALISADVSVAPRGPFRAEPEDENPLAYDANGPRHTTARVPRGMTREAFEPLLIAWTATLDQASKGPYQPDAAEVAAFDPAPSPQIDTAELCRVLKIDGSKPLTRNEERALSYAAMAMVERK